MRIITSLSIDEIATARVALIDVHIANAGQIVRARVVERNVDQCGPTIRHGADASDDLDQIRC